MKTNKQINLQHSLSLTIYHKTIQSLHEINNDFNGYIYAHTLICASLQRRFYYPLICPLKEKIQND